MVDWRIIDGQCRAWIKIRVLVDPRPGLQRLTRRTLTNLFTPLRSIRSDPWVPLPLPPDWIPPNDGSRKPAVTMPDVQLEPQSESASPASKLLVSVAPWDDAQSASVMIHADMQ